MHEIHYIYKHIIVYNSIQIYLYPKCSLFASICFVIIMSEYKENCSKHSFFILKKVGWNKIKNRISIVSFYSTKNDVTKNNVSFFACYFDKHLILHCESNVVSINILPINQQNYPIYSFNELSLLLTIFPSKRIGSSESEQR